MTYQETIQYLESFYNYERMTSPDLNFFNLERIENLVRVFGIPQTNYATIHITGTKGKGSVSHILSHILSEEGYRVGLYTSPHISDLRERIKINNHNIEKYELVTLVKELKAEMRDVKKSLKPSFFEIITLLAFNYFSLKKVDFAIFEVGMGGRLDATNVLMPLACGITSISYDHTRELGGNLIDIAKEKSEIIKPGAECISAPQDKDVMKVIGDKCIREGIRLYVVGRDITYRSNSYSDKEEIFDVKGLVHEYKNLKLPVLGEHQLANCTLAIGLAEILMSANYHVSEHSVYNGIKKASVPARCEVINRDPLVILDTAHNKASAHALKNTVMRNFKTKKIILILALSKDKDIKGICDELSPIAHKIVLTKADTKRAMRPDHIKEFFKYKDVVISKNIKEAYKISKDVSNAGDVIVITGSFFLAGKARKLFGNAL